MRRGEQYNLEWPNVDLEPGMLTIPHSKNGETHHVPLNQAALNSLRLLKNGDEGARLQSDLIAILVRIGGRQAIAAA
jgi:integrase